MAPDATGNGLPGLASSVARDGFAFLRAPQTRALLTAHAGPAGLADWEAFAASWNDLSTDMYMADGGRYRRRRHAIFAAQHGGPVERQPHAPHFQSRDYNPLNGGIQRWFEPILPMVADGPCMRAILNSCRALFDTLTPAAAWHIEVHQFRIEARAREAGQPTPEGMHRDGVDHVLVLMIDRLNIRSGVTSIHDLQGRELGSFTLEQPLDAAWVEDRRVLHGVTPVEPVDPALPARRDVLVATFLAQ
jgi:hypothetical protein